MSKPVDLSVASVVVSPSDSLSGDVGAGNLAPPLSVVRVHYLRRDGNYDGFGLHVWGEGSARETSWGAPLWFVEADGFGRLVEIEVGDADRPLSFIIHRGDEKDPPIERSIVPRAQPEIWLKQGRVDVWTSEPPVGPEVAQAVIVDRNLILARLEGPGTELPGCPPAASLALHDHEGRPTPIEGFWCEGGQVFVRTRSPLDLDRNHFLSLGVSRVAARIAGHLLDAEFFYDGDDLGAVLAADGSVSFKLWSPPATRVELCLYAPEEQDREIGRFELERGKRGVWSLWLKSEEASSLGVSALEGCFYQYRVTAYGRRERALDPYAKSMAAFTPGGADPVGKGAIVDPRKADPHRFREDDFSNLGKRGDRGFRALSSEVDFIGYEMHVRDFTIDPESGVLPELRGTFRGFVSQKPLAYLKALGVTHVQLMPVQAFYSGHECERALSDGQRPSRAYNWGYDPHNYFSPDGWLATSPSDPYARIRELKELVLALHRARIGVVLDVVYNHVYDARLFENAAPGCYLRLDQNGMPSGTTGAGPSLETRRRMTRKLIADSARYFAEEYGVDGLRFDLMEFIDTQTLREVRRAVGDDLLLHGEAWDFSDLPPHEATTKGNMPAEARLAAFSDSTRDAFTGRMAARGFVQGEPWALPRVQAGIAANLRDFGDATMSTDAYDRFAREPHETLNYLAIHDGFTLWDKLSLSTDEDIWARARLARLAFAMLFTSQGRLILHGGDEFGRTKPLGLCDPSPDRAHTSAGFVADPDLGGVTRLHENSYASPDFTNMVRWARLSREPWRSMAAYVRDLVAMRRALPGLRCPTGDLVRRCLRFLAGSHSPMPADGAGYRSFDEVPELTIVFKNGPAHATGFVVGEVFPAGFEKNPGHNPFAVRFDDRGEGRLRFTRSEMARFDLGAWSSSRSLQVKLVLQPGTWWTPDGAYSPTGNNTVRPTAIRSDNSVEIDLSIRDHLAGAPRPGEQPFVAFEIDQQPFGAQASPYRRLVAVFNAGRESLDLALSNLKTLKRWRVLLDEGGFSLSGRAHSPVVLSEESIHVPARSAALVGREW